MADTVDLKSAAPKGREGSNPSSGTSQDSYTIRFDWCREVGLHLGS